MDIKLQPGKYVVAVSGGVDSVVLLDLLSQRKGLELIVAHFDHGIREESKYDCDFVAKLVKGYGYKFVSKQGRLGAKTSEAMARGARYKFLFYTMRKYDALAVITAHHQDDEIETIAINILRGTGRRGISPLRLTTGLMRPLLGYSKDEIIDYAKKNNLKWREDETNKDQGFLRNYLRLSVLPRLTHAQKLAILELAKTSYIQNQKIDTLLSRFVTSNNGLNRQAFIELPHSVASELLVYWLRSNQITLDRKNINKTVIKAKTYKMGSKIDIVKDRALVVEENSIRLYNNETV